MVEHLLTNTPFFNPFSFISTLKLAMNKDLLVIHLASNTQTRRKTPVFINKNSYRYRNSSFTFFTPSPLRQEPLLPLHLFTMASMTIRIDPDMLWRCFCLHNVHSGAVTNPFHMNYYNFLSLLQKVDLPKSARLSNAQLGVIFRSVAYQTTAEIRKHKSMRTRIYEQSCNHKGNDVKRTSTHGNKLSYCAFLHALTKCAMAVYPQEPNHKQALGMFVYHYILAKQVREQNPVIHLPYDVHVDSAELFLQDEQVVLFFQQ